MKREISNSSAVARLPLNTLSSNSLSNIIDFDGNCTSSSGKSASNVMSEQRYVLDYEKAAAIFSHIDSITRQGAAIFNYMWAEEI